MKCTILFALSLIVATISSAQSSPTDQKPGLSKLSSAQLTACYGDHSICGASDAYEISDELAKRLPSYSSDKLIACMKDWKICGIENDIETNWPVSAELVRRGRLHQLLVRFWTEHDVLVRDGIVHAAYLRKTPAVDEFMKKVLAQRKGDDDALYWPANYLAKQCNTDALKWLSARKGRPEGCLLWAPTVALFGKCRYREAIPYIVENSIHDACLNIDDAGVDDLRQFFPHSPRQFRSMEEMQTYFCSRARKEGFKVRCSARP